MYSQTTDLLEKYNKMILAMIAPCSSVSANRCERNSSENSQTEQSRGIPKEADFDPRWRRCEGSGRLVIVLRNSAKVLGTAHLDKCGLRKSSSLNIEFEEGL